LTLIATSAGVIGLQTALSLLESGFSVTILAQHFPGDFSAEYTSPWAGGQWRSHAEEEDTEQREWDLTTLKKWWQLIEEEKKTGKKCGLLVSLFLHSSCRLMFARNGD
jgi:D-amino-acid oxidase